MPTDTLSNVKITLDCHFAIILQFRRENDGILIYNVIADCLLLGETLDFHFEFIQFRNFYLESRTLFICHRIVEIALQKLLDII